jgi:hypothetical protein
MSKDPNVHQLTVNIPVDGEGTHVGSIHGCRYPDGHIEWERWTDYSGVGWSYETLAAKGSNPDVERRWTKTLTQRAAAANIQLQTYIEDHVLLKRTVVLATTAPEEV